MINGTKTFVINGGPLAGFYIVLCRTDRDASSPSNALSTFLVEAGHEGITLSDVGSRLGRRLMPLSEVEFNQVHIPADNLIGIGNQGLVQVVRWLWLHAGI